MQVYKNVAVIVHAHICMVYSLANHYFIIFFSSARTLSFHLHSWATHHHHFTTHKNPITNSIENQSQNQRKIQTHPIEKPKSTKINRNQTWNQPQHIKRKTQTHPKPSLIAPSPKPSPNPCRSPLRSHPCRSPLRTQATCRLPLPPLRWFHFFYFFFVWLMGFGILIWLAF